MYPSLPKSEIIDAFAAASVATSWFIDVPEMEANSANKFFDGLASGTAMAINYGGWQADLLREHGAGLVLSRNIQEAGTQLTELLRSPGCVQAKGQSARKLAEVAFAREDLACRLEKVLCDAVA